MMVYEDFEMGGQRIRGPSSLKRIAPLREGVHSRVYSFYRGEGYAALSSLSRPFTERVTESGGFREWRKVCVRVCAPSPPSREARGWSRSRF